jgi:hypothetical protein
MKKSNTMTANTKANLIAIAVMAVILTVGIIYGLQLENSFYISENY